MNDLIDNLTNIHQTINEPLPIRCIYRRMLKCFQHTTQNKYCYRDQTVHTVAVITSLSYTYVNHQQQEQPNRFKPPAKNQTTLRNSTTTINFQPAAHPVHDSL
ncbi:hypothetical protein OSTOST_15040 [Ostertagia ostertagi]